MTHALAPFLSLAALLLALPAWAEGERIPSHCIALANAPAPQIQRAALTPPAEGEVLIHYLDHASFAIMAEDGTLAVTDYTGWTGSADLLPDAVTMNNAHGTHWTANPDPRIAHVLRGWATGMWCSSANCLTADACSFMPRPAGRSGWVSTSGIMKPAACRRSSATRANSGVPAKMTFTLALSR